MSTLRPFRGIRPRDDLAQDIIAPPYDVLSHAEAKVLADPNPRSFLHVTRPDVDLAEGVDIHDPKAYVSARQALDHFVAEGWMVQDDRPCFYLYSQTWRGRTQTALMTLCSTDEYDQGLIKKHELTRPDKENDRANHIEALDAQTGLVFLAYRDQHEPVKAALARAAQTPAAWQVDTSDEVRHTLQIIDDPDVVQAIERAFAQVPTLYVADGHHRSAAASRVAHRRGKAGTSGWFLAGIFPDQQLEVMAYNRFVMHLGGHTPEQLLERLTEQFVITPDVAPEPTVRGTFTMYLGGTWYGLRPLAGMVPDDPVGSLDVAVLQELVLHPLLGIENPRTDSRIRFIGGIRGHQALSEAVDGWYEQAVAFHMYPTGMDQLFAVADADRLMPPKSTWFEPKLRGGVLVHKIN